jgi:hypothetical protein
MLCSCPYPIQTALKAMSKCDMKLRRIVHILCNWRNLCPYCNFITRKMGDRNRSQAVTASQNLAAISGAGGVLLAKGGNGGRYV